jgi:hypothetical protein
MRAFDEKSAPNLHRQSFPDLFYIDDILELISKRGMNSARSLHIPPPPKHCSYCLWQMLAAYDAKARTAQSFPTYSSQNWHFSPKRPV